MAKRTNTALSLFSGAGGMDLGVSAAGFQILASIDLDPHCCSTLRHNTAFFGEPLVLQEDVRSVDPEALRARLGLKVGELDLLIGGPPCQTFSQIGKQAGLRDDRGLLVFEMARFARAFRPKAILMEQVSGFLSSKDKDGQPGGVFHLFLDDLQQAGYTPKWRLLMAADYGLPQLRKRVFVVATHGKNGFQFPSPTHGPEQHRRSLFPLLPYATVGESLKGIRQPARKNGSSKWPNHIDVTPPGDRRRIHGVPEGSYLACQHHLPKEQRGRLTKKDTTKYLRTARNSPSKTLRCGEIFFHPRQDRYLTPREYLRIHGYPDDYVLQGPIRSRSGRVRDLDQHRQVANSVPPPLALALATALQVVI